MSIDQLCFSENWNHKLDCLAFTSLRLHWPANYYVGAQKEIVYKGQSKGWAQIVAVKQLRLAQINDYIALLDTGYPAAECQDLIRKMYKNKNINWDTQLIDFILLRYI
jgi:hypothetical protein